MAVLIGALQRIGRQKYPSPLLGYEGMNVLVVPPLALPPRIAYSMGCYITFSICSSRIGHKFPVKIDWKPRVRAKSFDAQLFTCLLHSLPWTMSECFHGCHVVTLKGSSKSGSKKTTLDGGNPSKSSNHLRRWTSHEVVHELQVATTTELHAQIFLPILGVYDAGRQSKIPMNWSAGLATVDRTSISHKIHKTWSGMQPLSASSEL